LSFLGTNNYQSSKYYIEGKDPIETRFVQIASYQFHCSDFSENDNIYIFTTPTAKNRNWDDDYEFKVPYKEEFIKHKGLKSCFEQINVNISDENTVEIPEENSEEKIWETFDIIFKKLETEDEIVFDITHGFRSSPMLLMVLINYAKFLKNIKVRKILYGAFEAGDKTSTKIWDLTNFAILQDWTNGANEFLNFGRTDKLKSITATEIKIIIKDTEDIKIYEDFLNDIEVISKSLLTNRKQIIIDAIIFKNLKKRLKLLKRNLIKPFEPIIQEIENRTKDFDENENIINGFVAVKWCIDNHLIQQGITLLQENIISFLLNYLKIDWKNKENRRIMSSCLSINNKEKYETKTPIYDFNLVNEIFDNEYIKKFRKIYQKLNIGYRNDINHAGMNDNPNEPDKFFKSLEENYNKTKELLQNFE